MRTLATLFVLVLFASTSARGVEALPEKSPMEIISTGETTYENGIATARDNVAIHLGDTDIYSDYARYNSTTHEVLAEGHVRIYRGVSLYLAERGVYNTETKQISADTMRTEHFPYFVAGQHMTMAEDGHYTINDATFTTHDSSDSDFHFRSKKVRVYENDRVVFQNVTFLIGNVPVMWFPYLYQSLNDAFSFSVSPAYLSSWGASLLTQFAFPINDHIKGRLRLDYRSRRGPAIGFDTEIDYGKDNSSYANIKSYYIQDQDPLLNRTSLPRGSVPTGRYRFSVENRTNFTDNIYAIADITKLSDAFVLQDFYQNEFRIDPQPDNVIAVTDRQSFYSLTALARFQGNSFFETTERLPEVSLDVKRTPLFGGPIFYEGETSLGDLRRNFARDSGFEDYGTWRFDSFHQFLYPKTYFGWLSVVPRAGFRGTYYDETRDLGKTVFLANPDPLVPSFQIPDPTIADPIIDGGEKFRTVFNTGVEASFKISREWENAQNRALGLDGLRHVIQPFTNFSYVAESGVNPSAVLGFDRYQPSTQLRPIDFPQFTSIDAIDNWTVWRMGVRNRLETRRDDVTLTWFEVETYVDVNFENPYDRTPYSNLFNKIRFTPVPWATLAIDSQVPAFDRGFTEVNTRLSFQPAANLQVNLGHRYLNQNPFFPDSSLFVVGGYYRIDDNWGAGLQEQFESNTGRLEQQRYAIYRDLTSWVASVGAVVRDNGDGVKEYGIMLTFTLKAFPKFGFDFNFDPGATTSDQ